MIILFMVQNTYERNKDKTTTAYFKTQILLDLCRSELCSVNVASLVHTGYI
jgi:hypothetical protein